MTDPKWGTKRTCQSCGANFYDLLRDPIICPKCEEVFEPEAEPRMKKRSRTAKADAKALVAKEGPEVPDLQATGDNVDEVADGDENEDLIEDASDLGQDDDDVAEVMEGVASEDQANI